MKRINPGIPFLVSGVIFVAVGVVVATAWHTFQPLGFGAVFLTVGVVSLVLEKRTGNSK